jgi:hypothetical protein
VIETDFTPGLGRNSEAENNGLPIDIAIRKAAECEIQRLFWFCWLISGVSDCFTVPRL